jgi:ribosomal subunit interface protein
MHINTTARHCELATDDREFAHARLEKLQRFAHDLHEVHLVVTAERYLHVAELTLRLKQRELAVREEAAEPRRAIDLVADRAEHQLRRLHDRRVDHTRRFVNGPADGVMDAPAGEDEAAPDTQEG